MEKMIEIRWHGRGGQGAKTAAMLLAEAAFDTGKFIQGFPEYGPERMGAPVTAYNRISNERILVHSNIYEPDYVVVVDETLMNTLDVTAGLKKEGALLINSPKSPAEIREKCGGYEGRIYTIDADRIAMETLGKNFPNTSMLSAVVKITKVEEEERFLESLQESFRHKFEHKPQMIAPNMQAAARAFREVKE